MSNCCLENPQEALSLVTQVQLTQWGKELLFEFLDDPIDRQTYSLNFKDCLEIHWQNYTEGHSQDEEADLIGILLGKDNHQEPAIITTDLFEVSVLYGSFSLQKR